MHVFLYEHIAGQCGYLLRTRGKFYLIKLNINLLMHITNQRPEITYKTYWRLGLENLSHVKYNW